MTTFCYIISIFWVLSHYIYLCGLVLTNKLQMNKLLIIAISIVIKEAFDLVYWLWSTLCVCECAQLLQSCPTLCDPMDCSPPASSVRGISPARILEWVAMPSSRESSPPKDGTQVFCNCCIAGRFFITGPQGKLHTLSTQTKMFQGA